MTEYMAVFQQVVGNPDAGYGICYGEGSDRYPTRQQAIREGLKSRGSDDFNIAVIENDRLVSFDWMSEKLDYDDEFAEISQQLGLTMPESEGNNAPD